MKDSKGLPYCISFDTKDMPGKVVAIRVELTKMFVEPSDKVRVDLVDHPLYKQLEQYVLNNRSK